MDETPVKCTTGQMLYYRGNYEPGVSPRVQISNQVVKSLEKLSELDIKVRR